MRRVCTSGVEVISVSDYNTDAGAVESIDLVQAPNTTVQLAGSNAAADLEFTNVASIVDAVWRMVLAIWMSITPLPPLPVLQTR